MKKLLISLLVFTFINIDAQWYVMQFGVKDISELNEDQLKIAFDIAENLVVAGKILTIIGIPVIICGSIVMYNTSNEGFYQHEFEHNVDIAARFLGGCLITFLGIGLEGAGIPILASGASRKHIISVQLEKFNTSYIPSIGIRINF